MTTASVSSFQLLMNFLMQTNTDPNIIPIKNILGSLIGLMTNQKWQRTCTHVTDYVDRQVHIYYAHIYSLYCSTKM